MNSREHEQFLDALKAALGNDGAFQPQALLREWFRVRGNAYVFIFKKNLKATNIQLAELLALLRSHTVDRATGDRTDHLQFLSPAAFRDHLNDLVETLSRAAPSAIDALGCLAELYHPLFGRLLAVEPFFGSCAVFVPPTLDVDLQSVCALSGYVDSCGHNIYIRSTYKAAKEGFFDAVDRHLTRHLADTLAFLAVYCHEDFTGFDEAAGDLRSGLDDLKIYFDKTYMGPDRLVNVLRLMRERFQGKLVISEPGDYRDKHTQVRHTHARLDRSRTLWLLMDHGVGAEPRQRSDRGYYVCYDQLFHNENPFHVLDEDKPAWIDHTTIPHTLMGAMINLTRPWPVQSSVVLGDPFVGTGTTVLEGLKFPNVTLKCSDLDLMSPVTVSDNLSVFCHSSAELNVLVNQLMEITGGASPGAPLDYRGVGEPPSMKSYYWAAQFFDKLTKPQRSGEALLTSTQVAELGSCSSLDRIVFYLFLRTARRNAAAFDRGSMSWRAAFVREGGRLCANLKRLRTIRVEEEAGRCADGFRARQEALDWAGVMETVFRASKWTCVGDTAARGPPSRIPRGDRCEAPTGSLLFGSATALVGQVSHDGQESGL